MSNVPKPETAVGLTRTVVLVGLMGAGKSTVGRRLADRLGVRFVDSDAEIEAAADMTIPEIFERFDEQYFRDGERRVIARLLTDEPCILATGGGAFLSNENREMIDASGVSVWISADLETLWERVKGKASRPLLNGADPKGVLTELLEARYPLYETAEIMVDSASGDPHEVVVDAIVAALEKAGHLSATGGNEDKNEH
ncbi:MAG: shikimate kinase [Rhodobacteraceae bacterium]|nr:MAG: shikimate kinase [Paracoccaceae bacterium]